mmetsp:Transcript_28739/g.39769  ORF Transcript_28739/g.39769 Transcript_28739/m.39769 type:complete len:226 (+) Transcript_28739:122-799(+)
MLAFRWASTFGRCLSAPNASFLNLPSSSFHSSSPSFILSDDPSLKMFCGGIIERMPRLTQRPPEWKDEKLAFQKRIQEEKLKLKGLKPIQTVTEVIDDLFESEGVYKRPRLTKADKENNTRSINRKMENRLYFIVKKDKWEFPTLEWNSGETLRQTAERSNELHFPEFSIYVLSNSPDAHHDSPKNEKIQRTFFLSLLSCRRETRLRRRGERLCLGYKKGAQGFS